MAANTHSKKSAGCSPLLASASARSKPRRCENCDIRHARAGSGSSWRALSEKCLDGYRSMRETTRPRRGAQLRRGSMKSLFVGNMSFKTTESDLNALFKPFGLVTRVNVVKDRETDRARGFAFVEMPNDEEAAKAIAALDGKEVAGRNLKVNEARPKTEQQRAPRSSSGGRGRGGFSNEDY